VLRSAPAPHRFRQRRAQGPIIVGLLLASTIVIANFVTQDTCVIAIMSAAFFGQGMCNLGWTLLTDVAPKQLMGLSGGVFNLCANLAGIVTPLVVGFVVGATGSFVWALAFIGALALGAWFPTYSWSATCAASSSWTSKSQRRLT
jgi:hypothetical protein